MCRRKLCADIKSCKQAQLYLEWTESGRRDAHRAAVEQDDWAESFTSPSRRGQSLCRRPPRQLERFFSPKLKASAVHVGERLMFPLSSPCAVSPEEGRQAGSKQHNRSSLSEFISARAPKTLSQPQMFKKKTFLPSLFPRTPG